MPNTPCVVGEGMTVICGGRAASPDHLALARQIFSAVGKCLTVEENYFDAVTALSGSGPAYMYLILEALADGGCASDYLAIWHLRWCRRRCSARRAWFSKPAVIPPLSATM
jgi:hypothetical protein